MNKRLPLVLAVALALLHTILFLLGGGGHPHALYFIDFPIIVALKWLKLNQVLWVVA